MICSKCGRDSDKVIRTSRCLTGESIRRRRLCLSCGNRFTTFELKDSYFQNLDRLTMADFMSAINTFMIKKEK